MNPDLLVAAAGTGAIVSDDFGTTTIDVPVERWAVAATALRDDPSTAFGFFDWLSAYDDAADGIAVVARLWSLSHRHAIVLRTHAPADGRVQSLTGVWAGADWHEREAFEMFGVHFDGHPNLIPLLLPEGFEGHPLRKDFVLASRVAKDWPGAKEPGEGNDPHPKRRVSQPPGVPEPGTWGPLS
jgi:NADH-quinone oxidoreductase subunit C